MSSEIMSTLVALAVTVMIIALIFAILNLARSFRTKRDVRKAYHKARSRFYFGIFMIAFAKRPSIVISNISHLYYCFSIIILWYFKRILWL